MQHVIPGSWSFVTSSGKGRDGRPATVCVKPSHALHTLSLAHNQIVAIQAPSASSCSDGVCDSTASSPSPTWFPCSGMAAGIASDGAANICDREESGREAVRKLSALAAWCGASLEELRLSGNKLVALDDLRGCTRLRVLDVGRNKLDNLLVRHGI